MDNLIRGITVTLYVRTQTGVDAFNAPTYTEKPVRVPNVLVTPVTTDDVLSTTSLDGKKAVYELSIPKTDTHDWEDCRVDFFGKSWQTFGFEKRWIADLVPGAWNRKIQVDRYG